MSSFLLSVGSAADRLLPDIFTALSCGAAMQVSSLDVFSISGSRDSSKEASDLASSLSVCHKYFSADENSPVFPTAFSFDSCVPVFRDLRNLSENTDTSVLFDALRGKGLPFSPRNDREAVEWCFTDLLSQSDDPSVKPFFTWLTHISASAVRDLPVRLTLLADLSNPFSAGISLALLPFLRSFFEKRSLPVFVFFLALAETVPPQQDSFFRSLSSSLFALEERSLLRNSEKKPTRGADAMRLLSLPSSMAENPDSQRIIALVAARVLGDFYGKKLKPSVGFSAVNIDGILSMASLRDQAIPFAAFLRTSIWMLSDIFPAIRSYLSRPVRLRSLTVNPRNSLFRELFSAGNKTSAESLEDLSLLDSTIRILLSNILSLVRFIPEALRPSGENASLWQRAVNACGRCITIASELDTSLAEARESGLDSVRPVHRDSLADTEEEQLIRRLQDMDKQLQDELRLREDILALLGGYRSLQVRQDCYYRCSAALQEAQNKASERSDGPDHLTVLKRKRRIRLLEAAVKRCKDELDSDAVKNTISSPPASKSPSSDPYAFVPLESEACHALETLLSASPDEPLPHIPPLFPGVPEPDPKTRIRTLASSSHSKTPLHPVPYLFSEAYSVCMTELSSVCFTSDKSMPDVPLLPDIIADAPILCLRDLLIRLPGPEDSELKLSERRGILAMLLLRQYRRRFSSEAALSCIRCLPLESPVMQYWLSSRNAQTVYVLSLTAETVSLPFALILPGQEFLPAYRTSSHAALIPSFVTWYNRETDIFMDPCSFLGESDRMLLTELLSSYSSLSVFIPGSPLYDFLQNFLRDLSVSPESVAADENLKTRLKAVCGLRALSAYESFLVKETCFYEHFLDRDLVGSCLTGTENFPPSSCTDIPEDVLYSYQGVPFAREDSHLLLADPHAAGEDYTLPRLNAECAVLSESSDDYRDALLLNLQELLSRYSSIHPEIQETVAALLEDASKPLERREPVFTWPWDEKSPSILTVLKECLGNTVSAGALHPFSDLLTVFPARGRDIIGDALLSSMCIIPPRSTDLSGTENAEISLDAVLPPLSESFGRDLCLLPEGRTLLQPGLLTFERFREDKPGFTKDISDSFRVTLTLDGVFPVHMVRIYTPDETLFLYAHDIPTVALWPSVPFRPQDWHSYYLYAHMNEPYSVSALSSAGNWSDIPKTSENRYVAELDTYPVCLSVSHGDQSSGLLPNVLPEPLIEPSDPVEICIDFGSSGTSVVFSSSGQRRPLYGPVMVRTLLSSPASSRDLMRSEFIPSVPVSALLPTVSRIFRNIPGVSPVPFADGIVLMSSGLEDLLSTPSDAIYTSLKWEEEKGRSGFLCLHQIMLMAALQARYEGASALSWRFSLPDEMAKEGRESLMNLFLSLSKNVLQESGYAPATDEGILPVSFASESSALGAYFRYCAANDTRSGFMVLDLGACTADISLFLRGREQAVRTCQIPLGIHYMLLPSLLRDPDLLMKDFGFCPDESFLRDLSLLSRALSAARTDPVSLRRARISLDYFIADYLPLLLSLAMQKTSVGSLPYSGALVLLYLAYLMMLSGLVLLQLSTDPSKNDFLPEQMSLCLSGRGSSLLESLPPPLKTSLWHFLSMFRNRRVSSLSLLFSAEKKMEIPVGLSLLQEVYPMMPPAAAVPASIAVRPSELLPEFLLRFRREFPASAELLFPGFFTNDYYHPFTDRGESLISSSIDQSFPPTDTPRPYDSLSAWIGNILELATIR